MMNGRQIRKAWQHLPAVRRAAALLGFAAILFHAMLPLLHMPGALARTAGMGGIVLCTAQGIKIVAPADLAAIQDDDGPRSSSSLCPLCIAAHNWGGIEPPAAAVVASNSRQPVRAAPACYQAAPDSLWFSSAQPRAPPVSG